MAKGEKLQILKMLEQGKITAEEAVKLLETVEPEGMKKPAAPKRFLRVRVVDGDQERVNVNLPISLAKVALRIASKFESRLDGFDVEGIIEEIENGAEGRLVEVVDGAQRVELYVD